MRPNLEVGYSFLKIVTGSDMLRMFLLLKIFLPMDLMTCPNTFFCSLIIA